MLDLARMGTDGCREQSVLGVSVVWLPDEHRQELEVPQLSGAASSPFSTLQSMTNLPAPT